VKGTPGEHRQMDMSGHGKYLSEQGQDGEVTVIIVTLSLSSLLLLLSLRCCHCCCHVVIVSLLLLLSRSSHPFGAHGDAGPRASAGRPSSVACDATAVIGERR